MTEIAVSSSPTHRLAAVWFADIVGFTGLSARDESTAMGLVSLLQLCARRAVSGHGGRLVKFMGDEAMAEFGSTEASIRAALALKAEFEGLAAKRGVPAFLRIGVHVGDVLSAEGDIYGDGVNTASRIQREAKPGEVLVSEDVWRHLKGRLEFALEDRGEHELRGLEGTHRLYAVGLIEAAGKAREVPQDRDAWAIAVLPFVDISPGQDNEYFSDGMTEELIHSLSRVDGLRVASRTSSYAFKGRTAGIGEIAEALRVNVVLEGSVRKAGNRVRVTPLLVDAANGFQLWTDTYERELEDVFELQEAISGAIVDALQVKLGAPDRITRQHTRSSSAYEEYLKGRYYWNRHTPEDFRKSIEHYERAIGVDPDYALAWAGLADTYITMGALFLGQPRDLYPRARDAARKALELDPRLAAAQAALAEVQLRYDWDWEAAERGFRRALALDPDYADGRYRYGNYLRDMGRFDEAMVEIRRAQGMDPYSLPISAAVAGVFYHARRYDEAIEECCRALERAPGFYQANFYLAVCYLQKGMPEEALRQFERVRELAGFEGAIAGLVVGYAAVGRTEEAATLLVELRSMAEKGASPAPAWLVASGYFALGDMDEAFRWFDVAIEERSSWFTSLRVEPRFSHLHDDPRFQRLLARVGFPVSTGLVPNDLPAQPTSIVGRDRELKELRALIPDPGVRMLTLVGPGGVGKTRLAIEAAGHTLESFPDGVRFIPLSAIDLPDLLMSVLARALDVMEMDPDPRAALVANLRGRRMLLILDGFEHLLPAATIVAELLGELSELRVLVTSQATLRVRGEHVYQVQPLGLPAVGARERSPATLSKYGAVALFLDRLEAIKPTYAPSLEDLDAIVEICRQLDGLPLAIELAAARLRLLSPPALLGRLRDRFAFLVQGPRDLPERQQTLRAICDWSYGLLDPREQAMFRNLAPFAGGCSLEAAEWMAGERVQESNRYGMSMERAVLDVLASLVEKSLVRQVETGEGEPRFQMLETIRQYGLQLLDDLGETTSVRSRQLDYFLDLAMRAEPMLTGPDQAEWLDRLERDHENIGPVLDWALEAGEVERAVRLGSAMWWFFWLRGHFAEMRTRLEQALQRGDDLPRSLRANLLVALGAIASMDGEGELASGYYQRAIEIERGREDRRGVPRALRNWGSGLMNLGRPEQALPLFEEALDLDREHDDRLGESASLKGVAKANLLMGNLDDAERLYGEALSLARSVGDRHYVAYAMAGLGDVARERGLLEEAETRYQDGLDLCRRIDSRPGIASALQHIATIALATGQVDRSEELQREALEIARAQNNHRQVAISLAGLGACAVERSEAERGIRLLGAAERLLGNAGSAIAPQERRWSDARFAAARELVGQEAFPRLLEEGRSMSMDAAVELATARHGSPPGGSRDEPPSAGTAAGGSPPRAGGTGRASA
ncbi:MAG TPA: tetratricopeptide repeat protein [Gemmatimonadota bacterium]|nr:tetratricopeptide repeat protein [Gemmatimonadota bacterium]